MTKQFLSEREVAALGIKSMPTLRNDRWLGKGIPFFKVGRNVRYSIKDVREFLQKGRVEPSRRSG